MKIKKLSTLRPSFMVEPTFAAFIGELETLSNRLGIAVATTGGIVMFDNVRDKVVYQRNPCTADLEPVISEISKDKTASTASVPFDLKAFSAEVLELSARHGIRLVSMGAMSGLDSEAKGTMYLAIWSAEPDENQRD